MHKNADYWDLTSSIVGILAKIIRVFFCIFSLSPHSRCIGSICRQLLTYWYYRGVVLGFRSRQIPASWMVSGFPSVCGAAAVVCGNFTCGLTVVRSLSGELQLSDSPSQTWELVVRSIWNALLQSELCLFLRTETGRWLALTFN